MKNFKLCYIEGSKAYFTTQDLTTQWGDDWNDTPYEHNAGTPYEVWSDKKEDWNEDGSPKWEIKVIMFDAVWSLQTPAEIAGRNSGYSVQMINAGAAAWLTGVDARNKPVTIPAGASIDEFKQKIRQCGGKIYVEEL